MFRGQSEVYVKSEAPLDEITEQIIERLSAIAQCNVVGEGHLVLRLYNSSSATHSTNVTLQIKPRKEGYQLYAIYNIAPSILSWLVTICFFPVGALILILPYNTQSSVAEQLKRILDDIKYDIE